MRVIGGTARSVRLKSLKGKGIRPTMDRVREACFNILGPRLRGAHFLDLYAGTGANGIEALSRGAAQAVFVELNQDSIHTLEANLRTTKFWGCSRIIRGNIPDILGSVARGTRPFDLVYADPPFQATDFDALLEGIATAQLLAPSGLLIVEHPARRELPAEVRGALRQMDRRKYADVALGFYAPAAAVEPPGSAHPGDS